MQNLFIKDMLGSSARLLLLLSCWCLSGCSPASAPTPSPGAAPGPAPGPGSRGRLLRVPKVYNALITSDEPLLPSRTEQATVGQVLYYPPHPTYPASSGPLILPQVAAQAPPLYHPSQQQYNPYQPDQQQQHQLLQQQQQLQQQQAQLQQLQQQNPYQPEQLVSLPPQPEQQQQQDASAPPLEIYLQSQPQQEQQQQQQQRHQQHDKQPSPVVYASDVQQYEGPPEGGAAEQPSQSAQPPPSFPAARAVQTVERVSRPGVYQPPPAVHIDSIKNNRPATQGIRDVPPPPLPVGRRGAPQQQEQPVPPGILPF